MNKPLHIVILGLSITSSWGNGHATTFRGLVREMNRLGHRITFIERDVPWYACHRDLPEPPFCSTCLYENLPDLTRRFENVVREADAVIVGSYVPEGAAVGEWALATARGVVAFYDIDTPVTLAKLKRGEIEYLTPELIARYHLYFSFAGGRALRVLEDEFRSPCARPLYCSVDPELYHPDPDAIRKWDFGYMGTYSADRQPPLNNLLLEPARQWKGGRFVVAGPQYPATIDWPANCQRIEHLPPAEHRAFYNSQRFTLNVTRADMIEMGHSPSVRLFEAAACGTPVISDWWDGLDQLFVPGEEILISGSTEESLRYLRELSHQDARQIGERARQKVLTTHTARHRAEELLAYLHQSQLSAKVRVTA